VCASVLSAVQVQDLFDSLDATVHFLKDKMVKVLNKKQPK